MPSKISNEEHHTGASIRRTINIGEFETISVELPVRIEHPDNLEIDAYKTILQINQLLLKYASAVFDSRMSNIGRGQIDKLISESMAIEEALGKLDK